MIPSSTILPSTSVPFWTTPQYRYAVTLSQHPLRFRGLFHVAISTQRNCNKEQLRAGHESSAEEGTVATPHLVVLFCYPFPRVVFVYHVWRVIYLPTRTGFVETCYCTTYFAICCIPAQSVIDVFIIRELSSCSDGRPECGGVATTESFQIQHPTSGEVSLSGGWIRTPSNTK